jgi:hypothetical protein
MSGGLAQAIVRRCRAWALWSVAIAVLSFAAPARADILPVTSPLDDGGPETLRAQIDAANFNGVPDTITFALPGAGPFEIELVEPLPDILDAGTVIDGTTQPGYAAQPLVGTGGTVGVDGLSLGQVRVPLVTLRQVGDAAAVVSVLGAADVTIRGLRIVGAGTLDGITAVLSTGLVVEDNLIGLTAAGGDPGADRLAARAVQVAISSDDSVIRRNLIGYSSDTSCVFVDASSNALVEGNELIGCGGGQDGPQAGVALNGVSGATVRGNLVRGAFGAGVRGFGGNSASVVENNTITGNGQGGFATAGVLWSADQGAPTTGMIVRRNVIAANVGTGVQVTGGADGANVGNEISENAISGNGGQGIDLVASGTPDELDLDGPTLNDSGDGDQGGNTLQNFAVIDSARRTGQSLEVTGWAPAGARVELFASDRPSGFGQGERFLGAAVEGSPDDADGTVSAYGPGPVNGTVQGAETAHRFAFTFTLSAGTPAPTALVATATLADGTSEFGAAVPVAVPPQPTPPSIPSPQPEPAPRTPELPGEPGPADRADLPCTASGLVLVHVARSEGRVRVAGLARRAMAGRTVTIRAGGRIVARATVSATGVFAANAPLPPAGRGARIRYRAFLAGDASRALKLSRRMLITSTRLDGSQLVIAGRIVAPLARPPRAISIWKLGACARKQRVGTLRPRRDGRYVARLPAPAGPALYRLQTSVGSSGGGRTLYDSFTLFVDAPSAPAANL